MKKKSLSMALVLGSLVGLAFGGCLPFPGFCDYGTCDGTGPDAGAESSAPDVAIPDATTDRDPPPPGCDTPTEPVKNPAKCLVDGFGVFVSPQGDDGNVGTREKPVKTLGKALSIGRPRVVACEGSYAETLEIKADVEIYSGVSCDFTKTGGKAKIVPEGSTGVTVSTGAVGLFDIEVVAKAGASAGGSSIGILAKAGTKVTIRRSSIAAGPGGEGKDAEPTGNNHLVPLGGNPASGATGGATKTCACPAYGASQGGRGGDGGDAVVATGKAGLAGASNPVATTVDGATGGGGGGAQSPVMSCVTGLPGSPGSARQGGKAASGAGTVSGTGWVPAVGGAGEAGNPGQGGGGGGGSFYTAGTSAGGGGGGCGGCGGAGASGGGSGGASIGILAQDAQIDVSATTISTAKGGAGKPGGTGQAGGGGGGGGGTVGACSGGGGGAGAGGGGGAGGHGGPSYGIAYTGDAPVVEGKSIADAATQAGIQISEGGALGGGGEGGAAVVGAFPAAIAGSRGADGLVGPAKAVTKVEK